MDSKLCPFFKFTKCHQGQCALWIDGKGCSVFVIAKSVDFLADVPVLQGLQLSDSNSRWANAADQYVMDCMWKNKTGEPEEPSHKP